MKAGDKVGGTGMEEGVVGVVIAVAPQFNPANPEQEYCGWEDGLLVQSDAYEGVTMHGTPNTMWVFRGDFEVIPNA